jgi:prepilin-type N-terminal cleavage/methylation domain-containing protein
MNMKQKLSHGFTLIELLVVIAIIGILASIVLASLSSARDKGNDARRTADLHAVITALELYANDHGGQYPAPANPGTGCGGAHAGYCLGDSTMVSALVPTYLPTMPTDPTFSNTSWDYLYLRTSSTQYIMMHYTSKSKTWCWMQSPALPQSHSWLTTYSSC